MSLPGERSPSRVEIGLVLAVLVFVGNYLYVSDFGVYEDDYIFVTPGFLWRGRDALNVCLDALRRWPQGRPVGFALTYLLSYLTGRFDSLTPGYLAGYAIQWVNAALFFALASRFVSRAPALVATAVLALYPVNGAKQMLELRVFTGLNLTFLLSAFLLWTRGRRVAAYATATLCLLTYEMLFFPFVIAPLLVRSWAEVRWRRVAAHAGMCLAIPAALLVVRRQLGDPRVAETLGSAGLVLKRIVVACAVGPFTSVRGLVQRTWDGLWRASGTGAIAGALVALGAALLLDAMTRRAPGAPEPDGGSAPGKVGPLAAAGLLGLLAGYVLAFRDDNYPPIADVGRLSGFNVGGATGACLLLAAGLASVLDASRPRRRRAWVALSALLVAGLVSFGIELQRRDYVESWRQQREIWSAVLATSGEWTTSTPVVVDLDAGDSMLRSTPGFNQAWMLSYAPYAARQLVELPEPLCLHEEGGSWTPSLFGFSRTVGREAIAGGVRLAVHPWLGGTAAWPVLRDGEYILMRYAGERLRRSAEPLDTGVGTVRPRSPPAEPPPPLRPTRLGSVLMGPRPEWPTFRRARNYGG